MRKRINYETKKGNNEEIEVGEKQLEQIKIKRVMKMERGRIELKMKKRSGKGRRKGRRGGCEGELKKTEYLKTTK